MTGRASVFGELSVRDFLGDYWRKRPLLVRAALPDFASPVTPEQLFDLSCRDDVVARIVLEEGGAYPWEVRFGPFERQDLRALPDSHWTLLVQEVDRQDEAARRLLSRFRFVPNWRLDDLQISYAPEFGSAGPHVDNYDVFMIQGQGRRRWMIGHAPVPHDADFASDLDLDLLQDFRPDAEWVLEPGDMLYLPPRYAHWGVALEPCMTLSVGFRAPDARSMVEGYLERASERAGPDLRLEDDGTDVSQDPGRISRKTLDRVRAIVRRAAEDDEAIDDWFGCFVTEPQRGVYPAEPDDTWTPSRLLRALRRGCRLGRSAIAYLAYRHARPGTVLYACGQPHDLSEDIAPAAPLIAGSRVLDASAFGALLEDDSLLSLLADLVNDGTLRVQLSDMP